MVQKVNFFLGKNSASTNAMPGKVYFFMFITRMLIILHYYYSNKPRNVPSPFNSQFKQSHMTAVCDGSLSDSVNGGRDIYFDLYRF